MTTREKKDDEGPMTPNKQQQKMLNKLEEIGELKDVIVRGNVVVRLGDTRLRIEENGRVRYFDGESSDTNPGAYVGLIRLRERMAGGS
jgi:hypothetical protein